VFIGALASFLRAHGRSILLFLLLQALGLLLALDSGIVDFQNYYYHYQKVPTLSEVIGDLSLFSDIYGEPLYAFIQLLCKSLGLSYLHFRILFFALMMAFNAAFITKFRSYSFLVLLWYFAFYYHNDGNIIRTAFSSTLFMLGVYYTGQRRLAFSMLYFISASLMHSLAIIFPAVYLVFYLNLGRNSIILMTFLSLLIGLLGISRATLKWIGSFGYETNFF